MILCLYYSRNSDLRELQNSVVCGSTPSCSTAPLSQQLLQLPAGTKNDPCSSKPPCSHCHGEEAAARICCILGAAQLERKFSTHRSILGLLAAKEGLFFSEDTGTGGKEHPPQCPCPGAVSVLLFPETASSWAGFTPA